MCRHAGQISHGWSESRKILRVYYQKNLVGSVDVLEGIGKLVGFCALSVCLEGSSRVHQAGDGF